MIAANTDAGHRLLQLRDGTDEAAAARLVEERACAIRGKRQEIRRSLAAHEDGQSLGRKAIVGRVRDTGDLRPGNAPRRGELGACRRVPGRAAVVSPHAEAFGPPARAAGAREQTQSRLMPSS